MEQRAVIIFCVKLKKTVAKMFEMLKSAYSEELSLRKSLFECHKRFRGRELLQGDKQKGCPSTSRTEESTEIIRKCLAED
jgi:ubiquitin C-terminal hydrolase